MSFLVKGMEMPKDCIDCPFCDYEQGLCLAANDMDTAPRTIGVRHSNCPLVEVPTPHGPLIDWDELSTFMYHHAFELDSADQRWDSGCWIRYRLFENAMKAMPTIIEAEEGEEA